MASSNMAKDLGVIIGASIGATIVLICAMYLFHRMWKGRQKQLREQALEDGILNDFPSPPFLYINHERSGNSRSQIVSPLPPPPPPPPPPPSTTTTIFPPINIQVPERIPTPIIRPSLFTRAMSAVIDSSSSSSSSPPSHDITHSRMRTSSRVSSLSTYHHFPPGLTIPSQQQHKSSPIKQHHYHLRRTTARGRSYTLNNPPGHVASFFPGGTTGTITGTPPLPLPLPLPHVLDSPRLNCSSLNNTTVSLVKKLRRQTFSGTSCGSGGDTTTTTTFPGQFERTPSHPLPPSYTPAASEQTSVWLDRDDSTTGSGTGTGNGNGNGTSVGDSLRVQAARIRRYTSVLS